MSVVSYKVKKFRKVEKEKHIRVENTHEAIINKDGVRIDIWTHFMRGCIIDYAH